MKLNLFTIKKIHVIISLYFLISAQSILSLSNDRLKAKSASTSLKSELKSNTREPGVMMTYEANLTIENKTKNTKESLSVLIDKKSIESNSYGFEITPKDKAATILSPAFFLLSEGVYYFSLKSLTSAVDCLNDGLFSKNGMNFMLSIGGDNIIVSFKYPNSWAFGDKNDIDWLCKKISENLTKFLKEDVDKKTVVIEAITRTTDLEVEKSKNISSKTQLDDYIKFQKTELDKEKDKLSKLVLGGDVILEKLKVIESTKSATIKKNSDNDIEIASKEADIKNTETAITEYSNKGRAVKIITDADVDDKYKKLKEALEDLMKLHSTDDPMYAKVQELVTNVKSNRDKILNTIK